MLPAGFYYKTFMWPGSAWMNYEAFIRRAAGLGRVPEAPDPDRYDKCNAAADVLVIGGGSAGVAAALAAGGAGARVVLCERDATLGGQLDWRGVGTDDAATHAQLTQAIADLRGLPNVRILMRTTAVGYYDHNLVTLVERVTDHLAAPSTALPRERLWKLRARQVVVAAGAFERLLVFPGNDLPGVMLASAAHRYLGQFAVRPGRRTVVFANNDSAYATARALHDHGTEVAAIVDVRPESAASAAARAQGLAVENDAVLTARGRPPGDARAHPSPARGPHTRCGGVDRLRLGAGGGRLRSGGSPLFAVGKPACLRPGAALFHPGRAGPGSDCGRGRQRRVRSRRLHGRRSRSRARRCRLGGIRAMSLPEARPARRPLVVAAFAEVPVAGRHKAFVDLQNDVVAGDLRLAAQEGYAAAEHAKRYTTTGMGIDQGKIGNVAALAVLGSATARSVPEVGTTTFRPPFVPVTIGTLAGREIGSLFDPVRETPIGDWHARAGAVLEPVGLWRRPSHYLQAGESPAEAVARECVAVRERVGMLDASTLGKIELCGPDVVTLLNRVYTNAWDSLAVGQCRYGLMLRDSGMVFDDGVCARLADAHYLMSTTSGGAREVEHWLIDWLQCEWPELRVFVTPVTAQWATMALAGPRARAVLAGCEGDIDFSAAAFPHLAVRCGHLAGVPARVLRVSFTGELSFEINVPARYGRALWEYLLERGASHGIAPVGLDAIQVLRTRKRLHRRRPRHRRQRHSHRSGHGLDREPQERRLHRQARPCVRRYVARRSPATGGTADRGSAPRPARRSAGCRVGRSGANRSSAGADAGPRDVERRQSGARTLDRAGARGWR